MHLSVHCTFVTGKLGEIVFAVGNLPHNDYNGRDNPFTSTFYAWSSYLKSIAEMSLVYTLEYTGRRSRIMSGFIVK